MRRYHLIRSLSYTVSADWTGTTNDTSSLAWRRVTISSVNDIKVGDIVNFDYRTLIASIYSTDSESLGVLWSWSGGSAFAISYGRNGTYTLVNGVDASVFTSGTKYTYIADDEVLSIVRDNYHTSDLYYRIQGKNTSSPYGSVSVTDGNNGTKVITATANTGYTFIGWSYSTDGGSTYSSIEYTGVTTKTITPTIDITYLAHFEKVIVSTTKSSELYEGGTIRPITDGWEFRAVGAIDDVESILGEGKECLLSDIPSASGGDFFGMEICYNANGINNDGLSYLVYNYVLINHQEQVDLMRNNMGGLNCLFVIAVRDNNVKYNIPYGDSLKLTAYPVNGYNFSRWHYGTNTNTTNPYTRSMTDYEMVYYPEFESTYTRSFAIPNNNEMFIGASSIGEESVLYECFELENITQNTNTGIYTLCSSSKKGIGAIPAGAFSGLDGVTSITLPQTITFIEGDMFGEANTRRLKSITFNSTECPEIGKEIFDKLPTDCMIFVPYGSAGYEIFVDMGYSVMCFSDKFGYKQYGKK